MRYTFAGLPEQRLFDSIQTAAKYAHKHGIAPERLQRLWVSGALWPAVFWEIQELKVFMRDLMQPDELAENNEESEESDGATASEK